MTTQPSRRVRRFHELAEVGKVSVGAGAGGLLGWIATMASVSGSGAQYKVWTFWSVLLVVLSGVGLIGGAILWFIFHAPRQVIVVQPGATLNYNVSTGTLGPQGPQGAQGATGPGWPGYRAPEPVNQPPLFDQDEG